MQSKIAFVGLTCTALSHSRKVKVVVCIFKDGARIRTSCPHDVKVLHLGSDVGVDIFYTFSEEQYDFNLQNVFHNDSEKMEKYFVNTLEL